MEAHANLSDGEFETQFRNATFPPEWFSHEAHLRLAWIHIRNYGLEAAIDNICSQLVTYVEALGARDKYNKTLTIAAIRAVYHFMRKAKSDTFPDLMAEFPRLKYNFKELIFAHYGVDIFQLETAKHEYLEPDLLPFD